MRHFDLIKYSNELSELIDNYELIQENSIFEIEIRVATVWVVELLRRELSKRFPDISSATIDSLLWEKTQTITDEVKPYHRTYTISY